MDPITVYLYTLQGNVLLLIDNLVLKHSKQLDEGTL